MFSVSLSVCELIALVFFFKATISGSLHEGAVGRPSLYDNLCISRSLGT